MKTQALEEINELDVLKVGIELLGSSISAQDLCRRIAHAEFMNGYCYGVAVFLLNQRSVLVEVANYGKPFDFGLETITMWDDTVLSQAIRSNKVVWLAVDAATVAALPIQHNGVVTGVFEFHLAKDLPKFEFSEEIISMMSNLGGMYMESNGLSFVSPTGAKGAGSEVVAVDELTTRQVHIIGLIAEGLTNAEIARKVLLSESTVRQETIRIFRILKCHNRSEAIVKARANGILKDDFDTPPPRQLVDV